MIPRPPLYGVYVKQGRTATKAIDNCALRWESLPDTYLTDLSKPGDRGDRAYLPTNRCKRSGADRHQAIQYAPVSTRSPLPIITAVLRNKLRKQLITSPDAKSFSPIFKLGSSVHTPVTLEHFDPGFFEVKIGR